MQDIPPGAHRGLRDPRHKTRRADTAPLATNSGAIDWQHEEIERSDKVVETCQDVETLRMMMLLIRIIRVNDAKICLDGAR